MFQLGYISDSRKMSPFSVVLATYLYHKMNDIKIFWEFAKSYSCCGELKVLNRFKKVFFMNWIIVKRKANLCGGERVNHMYWCYWRISSLWHFYHHFYLQMIGLDELILNNLPSHMQMRKARLISYSFYIHQNLG